MVRKVIDGDLLEKGKTEETAAEAAVKPKPKAKAKTKAKKEVNTWEIPTIDSLNENILQKELLGELIPCARMTFSGEFTEACLGTVPKDPTVYKTFVLSKTPALDKRKLEEEVASIDNKDIDEVEREGWTGFHKDADGVFIYDYWILGNIKSGLEILQNAEKIKKITSYKKWADKLIKIRPRKIHFIGKKEADGFVEDENGLYKLMDIQFVLERPLRAMTRMGERVTVTRSDKIDAGTRFDFNISVIKNNQGLTPNVIALAIKLGEVYGLGQWRGSGGYGTYKVDLLNSEQLG